MKFTKPALSVPDLVQRWQDRGLALPDSWLGTLTPKIGKDTKEDYRIIEQEFCRSRTGEHLGWGLVVLPKEVGQPPLRSDQPQS